MLYKTKFIKLMACLIPLLSSCGGGGGNGGEIDKTTKPPAVSYRLSGAITGLQFPITLKLNSNNSNIETLDIQGNGNFSFTSQLANNASYKITLNDDTEQQTCSISSSEGTITSADVNSISVNCSVVTKPVSLTISGSISGVNNKTITLILNDGSQLSFNTEQVFRFNTEIELYSHYQVDVLTENDTLQCSIINGSGQVLSESDITNVLVNCSESVPSCSNSVISNVNDPYDLSGNNISGIESLVTELECPTQTWRSSADQRINQIRKATRTIKVLSKAGEVLNNAQFKTQLTRHDFKFGAAVRAKSMFDAELNLNPLYVNTLDDLGINKAGFMNALKYKQRLGQGPYIQPALDWFKSKDIPVRGHTLVWPKWSSMEPSVKIYPGDDPSLDLYKNISLQDLTALELQDYTQRMIANWASRWDVVEWDVANELRPNTALQDVIDTELGIGRSITEADWFNIARNNMPSNVRLFINDFQMISDMSSGSPTSKMQQYANIIDNIINQGGPIEGIGFQSRFGGETSAEDIYNRLEWFANKYPNLPFQATEFEIKGEAGKITDENIRALMTERVMTVYFSHPSVTDIIIWTIFEMESSGINRQRHIINLDGSTNLRGKIWLYLTKNHWHTDVMGQLDQQAKFELTGFKGQYQISSEVAGEIQQGQFELLSGNDEITIQLQ